MSKFKLLQEKYKKAQAEELKELNKKEKEFKKTDTDSDNDNGVDPFLKSPQQIKQPSVAKAKKTIQLRNELQKQVRQARIDKVIDRESKEKTFEPLIEELDKVVKAVKQTDEDLSKKLELMSAENAFEVTAPPTPIKKLTYKPTTMIGTIPRLYLPFPDDKFGIWTDKNTIT